jgi:hypothetical protein
MIDERMVTMTSWLHMHMYGVIVFIEYGWYGHINEYIPITIAIIAILITIISYK